MVQREVAKDDIAHLARRIFDKCGYSGDNGGNLWKAAALWHVGLVWEHEVMSAAYGARLNGRNPPAYFYRCLEEAVAKRGQRLTDLLRAVRIVPDWPRSRPAEPESLLAIIAGISRKVGWDAEPAADGTTLQIAPGATIETEYDTSDLENQDV